jgi:hypothetical protein
MISEAAHALCDAERERLPKMIWAPQSALALNDALRLRGHHVINGDLPAIFSAAYLPDQRVQVIVAVSPKSPTTFVENALRLVAHVYLLERLSILSSDRSPVFDNGQLARVLLFSRRLPGARTPMAWFVWNTMRGSRPPIIRRIMWRPLAQVLEGPEEAQRRKIREAGKLNPDPGPLFAKRKRHGTSSRAPA